MYALRIGDAIGLVTSQTSTIRIFFFSCTSSAAGTLARLLSQRWSVLNAPVLRRACARGEHVSADSDLVSGLRRENLLPARQASGKVGPPDRGDRSGARCRQARWLRADRGFLLRGAARWRCLAPGLRADARRNPGSAQGRVAGRRLLLQPARRDGGARL